MLEALVAGIVALAIGLYAGAEHAEEEMKDKAPPPVEIKLNPQECARLCDNVLSYDEYKKRCICK